MTFALIAFAIAAISAAENPTSDNYNLPLDRPYTQRSAEPFRLEAETHRQIEGTRPRSSLYPRPCISEIDSGNVCTEAGHWSLHDSVHNRSMLFSPVVGLEYRARDENVEAIDLGLLTFGHSGPLSFYLDARMFTELHEDARHYSFDREYVERQDAQTSGSIAYSSYSRFRSNLNYDWSWGRLTAARDAAHWGPGIFSNLVFNQNAIPFNQLTFTTHLGPLTVQSLYGQLAPDTNWEHDTTTDFRSVYAHRYEWRAGKSLLIGVSEQLLLFKKEAPFAFIPLVPLYTAKATEKERLNNGNIAGDFSWRFPGLGSLYSEFLIDDIQSPTSLFDDQWGNKWAWMAGLHLIRNFVGRPAGFITEYSRVEPWVYTHYIPKTAQSANFNYPLGNQLGPNSQALIAKVYWREEAHWYVSLRSDLIWKGTDSGSSVLDIHANNGVETKEFLKGVDAPELRIKPSAWYGWNGIGVYAEADLGKRPEFVGGVRFLY